MNNVRELFTTAVDLDPTRPLLTFYDDATGERTELSGATLSNWVAKTGNLLVDGAALGPGDTALVLLPPHWQTAAVLLGCWSAGLSVRPDGATEEPFDIAFVAADRTDEVTVGDRYALGLHPFGLPLRDVPPGYQDYSVEVRGHGDRFAPSAPADDQGPLCARAVQRAATLGIAEGARVLIDASAYPDPVDWLLAPLAARASLVLCGHLDQDRLATRVQSERVSLVV
ncbi:TIGR03089 family protein [Rugosimonospora acidiphila]|uniref:TIGR03089 family protein n=1 Tax=Rugosimonospora acidiphila TaxID=556531 RepID=A0ABP9SH47_9ACTN